MGDMGDMYRDWKADKKAKGAAREADNHKIIDKWLDRDMICGLRRSQVINSQYVLYFSGTTGFRFPNKPTADFYPTKNRWRKGCVIYYGDAAEFLTWYEEQETK